MSEPKEEFLHILEKFDNAMLVTHAEGGSLRARPMAIAEAEDDGDLWFATSSDTGKVDELAHDPDVLVTMQGPTRFLTIRGRAELVRDPTKISELWNEGWRIWFDKGKDDPRLILLHVRAREAEYWDRSGAKGLSFAFKAAKAYLKGGKSMDAKEQHGKINL